MVNDLNTYLNYFFSFIVGRPLFMQFGDLQIWLSSVHSSAIQSDSYLSYWLSSLASDPKYIVSIVIYFILIWFSLHLLLIWPFKWIRSIVKR